jgi:uncharacterized membrane protein YfcA
MLDPAAITWQQLAVVLPAVFFAGLVDAVAGGGGLISVPAYLAAGLPPHLALGTNKLSSFAGTLVATWRFRRHRLIDLPVALAGGAMALAGGAAGAAAVLALDSRHLRYFLVAALPLIAAFVLTRPELGRVDRSHTLTTGRKLVTAAALASVVGFYDGFFGPGTGTLLILGFTLLLCYDFAKANGNTKLINLLTNAAALSIFVAKGQVLISLGLPAAAAGILGNLAGSQLVIRRGAAVVRPMFLGVLTLLFGKVLFDVVHG